MFKREWSFKVLIRYSLVQLPGLVLLICILLFLKKWVNIPLWVMWFIPVAWVLKDMILFPFIWRAYDWDQNKGEESMIGLQGTASDRMDPEGYIMIRGELWRAEVMEDNGPVEKGEEVKVMGIEGLTLKVRPFHKNMS